MDQQSHQNLGELLEAHRKRLRAMIDLRIGGKLRERIDASDVIQETFFEASQRYWDYVQQPKTTFYVWLCGLTFQRLAILTRRHVGSKNRTIYREVSRIASSATSESSNPHEPFDRSQTPSQCSSAIEQHQLLRKAIDQLNDTDREIIILRHFEELSNAEVASILGIQPTTACNRYVRAVRRLKEVMGSLTTRSEFGR